MAASIEIGRSARRHAGRRSALALGATLCALSLTLPARADPSIALLDAVDAFRSRNTDRLALLAQNLRGQLLEDYPQYWYLQATLRTADPTSIKRFLDAYPKSPLAERLRLDWVRLSGERQEWDEFAVHYPKISEPDAELVCSALHMQLAKSNNDASKEARNKWLVAKGNQDACNDLLEPLLAVGALSNEDLWQRARSLLDSNFISAARRVMDALPTGQAPSDKHLSAANQQPQRFLDKSPVSLKSRAGRELTLFALNRLARSDIDAAAMVWEEKQTVFNPADRAYGWANLAYRAAMEHHPRALDWFRETGDVPLSDLQSAWRARAALRALDWNSLLAAIAAMSPAQAGEPAWRYWKGRALKADQQSAQAEPIFFELSKQPSFYGVLASEELGAMMSSPHEPWRPNAAQIGQIEALPGIQRALALYRLGLVEEGKLEWNYALRGLDDQQLLSAAEVAARASWYDRMISAADRTTNVHNFALRYPLPYRDALERGSRDQQLDTAWVFGLVRQESRFIADARSSAGAMGLMQLMPGTARWVAQRLGVKGFSVADAQRVETNASFGSYYLKHVLDELGHPVLATAAYNAGPSRARRWIGAKPMEGAIYAESIPFSETRDYVKKVMTNAWHYAAQVGSKQSSLKERLGTIPARGESVASQDSRLP